MFALGRARHVIDKRTTGTNVQLIGGVSSPMDVKLASACPVRPRGATSCEEGLLQHTATTTTARTMEQQSAAPKETVALVDFLRSSADLKPHTGILNGKRVEYFKGKHAIEALRSPAYAALVAKGKVPPAPNEEEAGKVLHDTIRYAFFLRADRGDKIKARDAHGAAAAGGGRMLRINPMQTFQPDMVRDFLQQWARLTRNAFSVLCLAL